MKKALGVFTVLHAIVLVDWIIVICCAFAFTGSGDFLANLTDYFVNLGNVFTNITSITNIATYGVYNLVSLILIVLTVALLLVWIIVLAVKKRPVYLWFIILVLLGLFPSICLFANFNSYLDVLVPANGTYEIASLVIVYLTLCIIGLSTVFFIVFYALGIANMCKRIPVSEIKEFENVDSLTDSIPEPTIEEPTVSFDEPLPEPAPTYVEGVEPEAEPAQEIPTPEPVDAPKVEEVKVDDKGNIDAASLARAIRDAVRDIVRDELARAELNKPHQPPTNSTSTVTGATFGGPLIVQYFNGGINSVPSPVNPAPQPEEVKKEEPKKEETCTCEKCECEESNKEVVEEKVEEPVVEEPTPEPQPVEEKTEEEKTEEPTPTVEDKVEEPVVEEKVEEPVVEEPAPAPQPVEEKEPKVYERISFIDRMINADKDMQDNYNILKNEILSYGVKSRVSNSGDTFRLHKKTYVKLTIAGKSLKLYFALDPKDYQDSTMPVQDAGHKGIYAEIPLVFKVRSELSMRRCKDLIQTVMEKDHLEQGEILDINWIDDLKAISVEKGKDEEK